MGSHQTLRNKLMDILGNSNVYYNPPENYKIKYPCIVFYMDDVQRIGADNIGYAMFHRYLLTYISYDPNETVVDALLELPSSSFVRSYKADNLDHSVINIYW